MSHLKVLFRKLFLSDVNYIIIVIILFTQYVVQNRCIENVANTEWRPNYVFILYVAACLSVLIP